MGWFDVPSYDFDGAPRLIKVKTTALVEEPPFFINRNELAFSREHKDAFHLYRLFEFRQAPKMFDLPRSVEPHQGSEPHVTRLDFLCAVIRSRATWRGTVNSGRILGRRFLARGSIRSGRCGSFSVAMAASTVDVSSCI